MEFEEPEDVQDIRLVVDTIPTLAWSAGPDGSADFFNHAGWTMRVYLQRELWARDGRLRFIQTTCHEFRKHSGKRNTDIEDRKPAEDALRLHKQNLRLLCFTGFDREFWDGLSVARSSAYACCDVHRSSGRFRQKHPLFVPRLFRPLSEAGTAPGARCVSPESSAPLILEEDCPPAPSTPHDAT